MNMLTPKMTEEIIDFVKEMPRTIQEISRLLNVNWRTANNYVRWIEMHQGTISMRTFRGGTRGALKIVYYRTCESGGEPLKKLLYDRILTSKQIDDFDFFDIYQSVDKNKRKVYVDSSKYPNVSSRQGFLDYISSCKENLFVFSGNVSWINLKEKKSRRMDSVIRRLLNKEVNLKVIARIDITSIKNIEHLLVLDDERELIKVRHSTQPLRGFIQDDTSMRFKSEISQLKTREAKKDLSIFYQINDRDWVNWMTGIFWNMFSTGMPYKDRLIALEEVRKNI